MRKLSEEHKIKLSEARKRNRGKHSYLWTDEKKAKIVKAIQDKMPNRICGNCGKEFKIKVYNQKFCKECAPTAKHLFVLRVYGLTKEKYDSMVATNNGLCWICCKRKAAVVDHDHKTGNVRGLLCKYCNIGLSFFDNKTYYERALKYLSNELYSVSLSESSILETGS